MEQILKHRAEIYGLLAIWIMVFHLDRAYAMPNIPLLTNFVKCGNAGVDVFLFLSGYCLYLSLNRNSSVGNFFRKRFKRVVLVYLVIAIPFFLYKAFFETRTNIVLNFLYDLSGLSFWFDHCIDVWFVHAIILFYIFTIPFYHMIKKGIGYGIALMILLFVVNYLGHEYLTIYNLYNKGSIGYIRILPFVFGMVIADAYNRYHLQERFQCMKQYSRALFSIILIGCLVLYLAFDVKDFAFKRLHSVGMWLSYFPMILPFLSFFLLVAKLSFKVKCVYSFLHTVGIVSLEFYLIHVMVIHIIRNQGLLNHLGASVYIIVPLITLPLSMAANKLSDMISNKLIASK